MKSFKLIPLVASLVSVNCVAEHTRFFYIDSSVSFAEIIVDGSSGNALTYDALIGGYVLPNVGVEMFLGSGVSADIDLDYYYGLSLAPRMNLHDDLQFYGRVGLSEFVFPDSIKFGFMYGVGTKYKVRNRLSTTLEYVNHISGDEFYTRQLSAGLRFDF